MRSAAPVVPLPLETPIWSRVFTVAPLVLVGTLEDDGAVDLAPKHMAMPLGWHTHRFGFVCSPRHATYHNAVARGSFTVSFPRPDQIVEASMAAGGRLDDHSKPSLAALTTVPASRVEGPLVEGCSLWLECTLDRIVEIDDASLVIGTIVAAAAAEDALRLSDRDDSDLLAAAPALVYLSPGRFAPVAATYSFPYPADFHV
jgi:flavin reductase (DIM6/NTAB) family NADH-FMN oxidoreductase RutF